MRTPRPILWIGLIVALLPAVARAEVSVQLDRQGNVKRVVFLTKESGGRTAIWSQMRGRIPLEVLLNPLGDTYGDLRPVIATHPVTGMPWVVWARNEGNQKRIVVSGWEGRAWSAPAAVAQPDMLGYDQIEPQLVFDAAGAPYIFYTEVAPSRRILVTTFLRGRWTPPLLVTDRNVDSASAVVTLNDATFSIDVTTPDGPRRLTLPTSSVLEAASKLMDSPIPPGSQPSPGTPGNPGDNGAGNGDDFIRHK